MKVYPTRHRAAIPATALARMDSGEKLWCENYQQRSILGGFSVDFGILWGSCRHDLGRFWVGPRHVLPREIDSNKFSKHRFFENRCTVCSLEARIRWSGSGSKINFDKVSVPARPAGTRLVVSRKPFYVTQRRGPALYVVTDFPFYGCLRGYQVVSLEIPGFSAFLS